MDNKEFKTHSLKYNLMMNIILKASSFIFPLITFPYVSRVLGTTANGKISFATSVVSYFVLIASLGIPTYGLRKCAELRDDKKALGKCVKELLIINSCSSFISYIMLFLCVYASSKLHNYTILILVTSLNIVFNTMGVEWFYQAIEQYDYITYRNIIAKVISVILMFLFVNNANDYVIYAAISMLATCGSNFINIIKLSKYVDIFENFGKLDLKQHLSPIFTLFFYNAATSIYVHMDQVMLGFMVSDTEVGYYSATIKIKSILLAVITALGTVAVPRVTNYLKQNKVIQFNDLITKSFNYIFFVAIPIIAYSVYKAKPIIMVLAGEEYLPSAEILKYVMLSLFFIGLTSVTAWQMLIPLRKEKVTVIGAIVGALTDLILNILLIPKYGAVGATIGTLVAEISVWGVHLYILRKRVAETFRFKELGKSIISSVVGIGAVIAIDCLRFNFNALLNCLITGSIFLIIYCVFQVIFKSEIMILGRQKFKENKGLK